MEVARSCTFCTPARSDQSRPELVLPLVREAGISGAICQASRNAKSSGFSEPLVQNSRHKDGTTKNRSIVFSIVPYRALQSDRCLVITTGSSLSAPFHGANAGSDPAGDAK